MEEVDETVIGHARQAGSGPNPARQVGRRAGLPDAVPAQTINKTCASGLQAIASGAQSIMLGDADVVVAGGIESMSRMPYLIDAEDARWGHRMGTFALVDAMYRDGFVCSRCGIIMGETAELLARQSGIGREESDCFALESQRRAATAIEEGRFSREMAPVSITLKGQPALLDRDEHPRPDTAIEGLRKLQPAFGSVEGRAGIITAGSSSGITDGGAAVVLAPAEYVQRRCLMPRARILGWASAGVDPRMMGIGAIALGGLATLCVSGGMGMAMAIERI